MKSPVAILFDLDGVLLNTEPLNRKAWKETSKYFQCDLNSEQLQGFLGRRKIDCAKEIIKISKGAIEMNNLLRIHKHFHRMILSDVKAIPFAKELIIFCHEQNISSALVTSSTEESVKFKTKNHSWIDLINIKIYGDNPELNKGKPHPDPFLLAAQKLTVNSNCCWAVEDSSAGITSAIAAGCQVWQLLQSFDFQNEPKYSVPNDNPLLITKLSTLQTKLKETMQSN